MVGLGGTHRKGAGGKGRVAAIADCSRPGKGMEISGMQGV